MVPGATRCRRARRAADRIRGKPSGVHPSFPNPAPAPRRGRRPAHGSRPASVNRRASAFRIYRRPGGRPAHVHIDPACAAICRTFLRERRKAYTFTDRSTACWRCWVCRTTLCSIGGRSLTRTWLQPSRRRGRSVAAVSSCSRCGSEGRYRCRRCLSPVGPVRATAAADGRLGVVSCRRAPISGSGDSSVPLQRSRP